MYKCALNNTEERSTKKLSFQKKIMLIFKDKYKGGFYV